MPNVGGIAGDRLKSFIERIERLEEEKRTLGQDIKEVYAEAKGSGFDTKIMRQLIKERRMDKDDFDEQQSLLDVYRRALGMLADTPLGEAAIEKAAARKSAAPKAAAAQKAPAPKPSAQASKKPEAAKDVPPSKPPSAHADAMAAALAGA